MTAMTSPPDHLRAGLCATCRHAARITNDRGSVFYRCGQAAIDPSYRKYPVLPVGRCAAHAPAASRPRALVSWSGGKDACVALHRARVDVDIVAALTMMDESGARSRSHGLRSEVLQAQVEALGVRWFTRPCGWDDYEARFVEALREARAWGVTHLVCGDILYPEHRAWVERVAGEAGLDAVEPIFGTPTPAVYREFLAFGGRARIVAAEARVLGADWLFRELDEPTLEALMLAGADPCGENGEYHTVVTACPAFAAPLALVPGERVQHRGYWAMDVRLA